LNDNIKLVAAELRCHIKMILNEALYEAWAPVGVAGHTSASLPMNFWVKLRLKKGNVQNIEKNSFKNCSSLF
jgi:hypothetical protein